MCLAPSRAQAGARGGCGAAGGTRELSPRGWGRAPGAGGAFQALEPHSRPRRARLPSLQEPRLDLSGRRQRPRSRNGVRPGPGLLSALGPRGSAWCSQGWGAAGGEAGAAGWGKGVGGERNCRRQAALG